MLLDHHDGDVVLLIDGETGHSTTVADVRRLARIVADRGRRLTFLLADRSVSSALWFHALLEAGNPVVLVDPGTSRPSLQSLIQIYDPGLIVGSKLELLSAPEVGLNPDGFEDLANGTAWLSAAPAGGLVRDLAVLLTTSGSTGSPKLVRLSRSNVRSNAGQIADSLEITSVDRGVTTLPFFYSFGMSVLTSHAIIGSPVIVTNASVLEDALWSQMQRHEVTIFAGVPTTYAMLKRLGFEQRTLPTLRTLTQAGGRLDPDLIRFFHLLMEKKGGAFMVMYGQTEASPRIACLPSACIPEKLGSVGKVLNGGKITIESDQGEVLPTGVVGEVVYRGPNVMMGYAEEAGDLSRGAEVSALRTGDLGFLDADGFLFLSGRSRRICKLAGKRISLDEVEQIVKKITGEGLVATVGGDDKIDVFLAVGEFLDADLRRLLAKALHVPPKFVRVRKLPEIPLLSNGKIDYRALEHDIPEEA